MTDPAHAPAYATLSAGQSSVTILPALGGRIRDLTLGGRQWLWHNPDRPFTAAAEDASLGESVGSGGFDECFPTVAACTLPSWVEGAKGARIGERGALWRQRCDVAIATEEHGHSASCTWQIAPLSFEFKRRITVRPDGMLDLSYAATNTGGTRLPFLWAAHPVFPLTASTRILLPEGAQTRVWMSDAAPFAKVDAAYAWPRVTGRVKNGERAVDVSRPAAIGARFACTIFVALPRTETSLTIVEGRHALELRVHGRELSHAGVWINRGVLAPTERKRPLLRLRRARTYSTITLAPCLGAPESLADALSEPWETARWIEPGATARWAMTLKARPA